MAFVRYLRDAAVFAPCYIALDWASYIDPLGPFNITPWNPQAALAIVWMLAGGLRFVPAVMATIYFADLLVRDAPGGQVITLLSALTVGGGYGVMVWLLRELAGEVRLRSTRELTLFATVVVSSTAFISSAFVGLLRGAGLLGGTPTLDAFLRFWVGDAVGILVTAPLLLAAADTGRRAAMLERLSRARTLIPLVVLAGTVWLVFGGLGGDPAVHFYFLFVPLIWIAVRGGVEASIFASAIVQLGVVAGMRAQEVITLPVLELQALVATLTLTGLYLGVMVDERQRAEAGLRESLRLAAAGEMAGAIAHEVNQPLTALANYGRAAQMLLARQPMPELDAIITRMLAESARAADVVRRLRDFFRTGTTRLEAVPVADLLAAARRIGEALAADRPIAIATAAEADLPLLYIDRLQVELVLRNLVANAVESLQAAARKGARVDVRAERHDEGHVRIVVTDNGPGIAAHAREQVFQPFVSGKPTGMGLGLAVSRAIAEAHGGSLDAAAARHGEFHLVLPCTATR